jgi:hypothetical protein
MQEENECPVNCLGDKTAGRKLKNYAERRGDSMQRAGTIPLRAIAQERFCAAFPRLLPSQREGTGWGYS